MTEKSTIQRLSVAVTTEENRYWEECADSKMTTKFQLMSRVLSQVAAGGVVLELPNDHYLELMNAATENHRTLEGEILSILSGYLEGHNE